MEEDRSAAHADTFIRACARGTPFEDFLELVHRRVRSEDELQEVIDLIAEEQHDRGSTEAFTADRLRLARTTGIFR